MYAETRARPCMRFVMENTFLGAMKARPYMAEMNRFMTKVDYCQYHVVDAAECARTPYPYQKPTCASGPTWRAGTRAVVYARGGATRPPSSAIARAGGASTSARAGRRRAPSSTPCPTRCTRRCSRPRCAPRRTRRGCSTSSAARSRSEARARASGSARHKIQKSRAARARVMCARQRPDHSCGRRHPHTITKHGLRAA